MTLTGTNMREFWTNLSRRQQLRLIAAMRRSTTRAASLSNTTIERMLEGLFEAECRVKTHKPKPVAAEKIPDAPRCDTCGHLMEPGEMTCCGHCARLTLDQRGMLREIINCEALEVAKADWEIAESLAKTGLIVLYAPDGPYRHAELVRN